MRRKEDANISSNIHNKYRFKDMSSTFRCVTFFGIMNRRSSPSSTSRRCAVILDAAASLFLAPVMEGLLRPGTLRTAAGRGRQPSVHGRLQDRKFAYYGAYLHPYRASLRNYLHSVLLSLLLPPARPVSAHVLRAPLLTFSRRNVPPAQYTLKYNVMPYVGLLAWGEAARTSEPIPFPEAHQLS